MSAADETRRAACAYRLTSAAGLVLAEGEGDALVDDDGVSAGSVRAEFLDADALTDEDRSLVLGLHDADAPQAADGDPARDSELSISRLGRRHETFARALAEARDRARTAGALAHGLGEPEVFEGAARRDGGTSGDATGETAARLLVYATHLTVVPAAGDPFQVPHGAVRALSFDDVDWTVRLDSAEGSVALGKLARHTDAFRRAVSAARDAQARRLAAITGTHGFADGLGVPARDLPGFDRLLARFIAPQRAECAAAILARATTREDARLGLVELLDPDEDRMEASPPLPPHVAAFLLVPVKDRVVLEILSGPSAATYVFRGTPDAVNRDLQALHFRRRPLALTDAEVSGAAGRPYRLALRRSEPLRRLRAATTARLVHGAGWAAALEKALG